MLLAFLATTAAVTAQATTEPDTTALEPVGALVFTDSAETRAGAFQLALSGLVTPPDGSHYELWLHSDQTDTLSLGELTFASGQGTLQGSTDHNLLLYDRASITLEADEASESDGDDAATISDQIVLTATLPKPLHSLLMDLLVATESANADAGLSSGFIAAAQTQAGIAVQHTGFLRNALGETDLPQARRHTEHIINILDGKNGFMYGDLDRDGRPENPGDGFGVRPYLDEARTSALDLVDLTETMADWEDQRENATAIVAAIATGQSAVAGSFDKALQIFASDTVTEASIHAQDLSLIIDGLAAQLATAYDLSLSFATYTFYAPPVPDEPATSTPTVTPTASPTPTPSPTQPPATATRTLAPTQPPATATQISTETATPEPTATLVLSATVAQDATAGPTLALNAASRRNGVSVARSSTISVTVGQGWRNPADGALYVYVAGGEFTMGSTAEAAASPREEPRHNVTVGDFWLQQTETTNAQYAHCVSEGACTPPANTRWDDPAYADHPVTDVDWGQATAYATWVGGRLPTEAEWEKACRSNDARTFPWGNEAPTAALSNYNNSVGDTAPVGSYPDGASPDGALDLSGNVWEWVSSLDADYPYNATDGREDPTDPEKRIVRGGSFYYTQYQIRCAARTGFVPDTSSQHIGFRVVLETPQ
ncbi:MAG: formylglycine-generating enzyme family protein [Caldilineaceae bacterium]